MMKNSLKRPWAVVRINFWNLLPAYIITAAMLFVGLFNLISCFTGLSDNYYVEMGNYLYALPVFAAIMIPSRNFKKIMHLNGAKRDFYWGSLLTYMIIAAAVSALNLIMFAVADAVFGSRLIVQNLTDIFGWWKNGIIIAFLQQFSFSLLLAVFVHTLTSMHNFWFGWAVDILLCVVLSVLIPIPMLRNVLVDFFNIIIFQSDALLQIICCLVLTAGIYALELLILREQKIK